MTKQKLEKEFKNLKSMPIIFEKSTNSFNDLSTRPRNRRFINPEEAKKAYNDALQKIQDTGHLVFNPGSPFVSIEARCMFNAEKEKAPVEIPSKPGLFNPTRSTLDTFSANVRNEINKYLTDFGANNGFPVVYVLVIKNENGVGKVTCEINMYKKSDMHAALGFARHNGGELGMFNSVVKYIDELNP